MVWKARGGIATGYLVKAPKASEDAVKFRLGKTPPTVVAPYQAGVRILAKQTHISKVKTQQTRSSPIQIAARVTET